MRWRVVRHCVVRRRVVRAAAALLLAAAPACAREATADPSADPAAAATIRAARLAQNAQLAAGDLNHAAALWTEDVSVVAGLGRAISGRATYRAAFARGDDVQYARIPDSVVVSAHWPLASEWGHWTGRTPGGAAGGPTVGGTYAAQWVRGADGWHIRAELFTALDCGGDACAWPATTH